MSIVYMSHDANPLLQKYIRDKGHQTCLIPDIPVVYPEVSAHADLYMCKLGALPSSPVHSIGSLEELGFKYPNNIKYNGVCMGDYFIHTLKYTAPSLLEEISRLNYNLINTNQGYTKCNMVLVSNNSAITSDIGIYNSIQNFFMQNKHLKPLNLLLINKGHVLLKGFSYGFLGGASGRIGNEIVFNGNLEAHPDFHSIFQFIKDQGLTIKYFEEYPLEDIGSIIESPTECFKIECPIEYLK